MNHCTIASHANHLPRRSFPFLAAQKRDYGEEVTKAQTGSAAADTSLRAPGDLIPHGSIVLELGCGEGELLAGTRPSYGVGVDLNPEKIQCAKRRYPWLHFYTGNTLESLPERHFEYIIISDFGNKAFDVHRLLTRLRSFATPRTRLLLSVPRPAWPLPIDLLICWPFGRRTGRQNTIPARDLENLLDLTDWQVMRRCARATRPAESPLKPRLTSHWLIRLPRLHRPKVREFHVARPRVREEVRSQDYSCSVVIAARNEESTIRETVERVPSMGSHTEIIVVEGHSHDGTWQELQKLAAERPEIDLKIVKQQSVGKGGAVREGFAQATGDVLFILDADLTVRPEELQKFYRALRSGVAEFINGVRLVYPMEAGAMPFLNRIANRLFSVAFSWLLGRRIRDTLCGTKVFFRRDYEAMMRDGAGLGEQDPFGDFDFLLGAVRLNLRMRDLPVRYYRRRYGKTNIRRWRDGWRLLKVLVRAALECGMRGTEIGVGT